MAGKYGVMESQIQSYLAESYYHGRPDRVWAKPVQRYMVIKTPEGDRVEECKTVVVHEFTMSDFEDPDLYAAQPLIEWERSEQGQWVMRNAVEVPTWFKSIDTASMGYRFKITAKLTGSALTEWLLRYGG